MTTPRYVIEFPESVQLTSEARAVIAGQFTRWLDSPDSATVLDTGARIRSILPDGTITPSDPPVSELVTLESTTIAWPILVLSGAIGAVLALAAQLAIGAVLP